MRSKIGTLSIMKKEEERGVLVKLARWAVQRRREWESKGHRNLCKELAYTWLSLHRWMQKLKVPHCPAFSFFLFLFPS